MVLYLSSQKFGDNHSFLKEWIKNNDKKILLIFNALEAKGQEKINNNIKEDKELLENIGFDVDILDLKDYFDKNDKLKELCQKYKAFCIMGGNVFILRQAMKYSGFDNVLKEISKNNNYLYIGYSAGSCILSKKLELFKNIDEPIDFYNKGEIIDEGIGLIDYLFIPHYKSNYHKVHLIDELIKQCKNKNIKYKALKDGEVMIEKKELEIKEGYKYKEEIKLLFNEYTEILINGDKTFKKYLKLQNYDNEIENLEEKYGKPEGRLYIAFYDGKPAGCIALKKIDKDNCEMKRLYVRNEFRGKHIGSILTKKIIEEAKEIGYKHVLLDTLSFLENAINIYKKIGFYEIEQYNNSPMENAIYLKLDL